MNTAFIRSLAHRHSSMTIFLIALTLAIFFIATSDGKWANSYNIASMIQITATLAILALGVSLVIGTGEIDISVGSTFGFGALIYLAAVPSVGPVGAALAAMLAGFLIGLMNGFLVTRFHAPSLIITLSTLMIFRGLSIALTKDSAISIPWGDRGGFFYQLFGGGSALGVNSGFVWMIVTLVLLGFFIFKMPLGNHLLAVGGSVESAHSRGIQTHRVKITAFALAGILAGFAGVLEGGKLGFADGDMGKLMELQAIAACVLGGSALAGGRLNLVGVILGAFVLSSIQSYLVVTGIPPQWFIFLLGLIIVLAALGNEKLRRWTSNNKQRQ